MLLKGYRKEISRPECNPNFVSVHCIAHLDEDVTEALPYLNATLGGYEYIDEPRSVTFRIHGRLITVHGRRIAINALKDGSDADKILLWLKKEINEAWEEREDITPSFESMPRPRMIEILRHLPKTNCKECNEPTCTVFAIAVTEGVKDPEDCPGLDAEKREALKDYLSQFNLEM